MTSLELDWAAAQVDEADATEMTHDDGADATEMTHDDEADATEMTHDDEADATEITHDDEIALDADSTEATRDKFDIAMDADSTEATRDKFDIAMDADSTEATRDKFAHGLDAGRTIGGKVPRSEIVVRDILVEPNAPLVNLPVDSNAAFSQWLAGSQLTLKN